MAICEISILEMVSISSTSQLEQQHINFKTVIISGTDDVLYTKLKGSNVSMLTKAALI